MTESPHEVLQEVLHEVHGVTLPARAWWGLPVAAWLAAAVIALLGAALIVGSAVQAWREAFDTDARIAHRLLSQKAAQHDAVLAMLALLQGGPTGERPEARLPALYAQVRSAARSAPNQPWDDAAWQRADDASRRLGHAVIAGADLAAGSVTLLLAARPSSAAITIDLARIVPWDEWPGGRDGAMRTSLRLGNAEHVLQPGASGGDGGWRFETRKPLASDSQPFELVAARRLGWAELPWGALALWAVVVAAGLAAARAALRLRAARRRAEERVRLDQVGRLNHLGELAAGMAHELNQPLTALLASTQTAQRLVAEEPPELDDARIAMARAVQQAQRASEVLKRLRQAVERPGQAQASTALRLDRVAREAIDLLDAECRARQVQPRLAAAAGAVSVWADPVGLQQIVHNLLMNALQALDNVGARERTLEVDIASRDGRGVMTVRDSGPGIDAALLPRLFEPFVSGRPGGLGLGLALCESLAGAMQGRLVARNRTPRGAEFELSLPLATAAGGAPA